MKINKGQLRELLEGYYDKKSDDFKDAADKISGTLDTADNRIGNSLGDPEAGKEIAGGVAKDMFNPKKRMEEGGFEELNAYGKSDELNPDEYEAQQDSGHRMGKFGSFKGYDFYEGTDGNTKVYNMVPEGSEPPSGGYIHYEYITKIKSGGNPRLKELFTKIFDSHSNEGESGLAETVIRPKMTKREIIESVIGTSKSAPSRKVIKRIKIKDL